MMYEISQRAYDGLWQVWRLEPVMLTEANGPPEHWRNFGADSPWITQPQRWVPAGVFGRKVWAEKWIERKERRKAK